MTARTNVKDDQGWLGQPAAPQLLRLKDGWVLVAGRDYAPGKGVVRGALMLTDAELGDLRSLLAAQDPVPPKRKYSPNPT